MVITSRVHGGEERGVGGLKIPISYGGVLIYSHGADEEPTGSDFVGWGLGAGGRHFKFTLDLDVNAPEASASRVNLGTLMTRALARSARLTAAALWTTPERTSPPGGGGGVRPWRSPAVSRPSPPSFQCTLKQRCRNFSHIVVASEALTDLLPRFPLD